jgi:hypothetical protein
MKRVCAKPDGIEKLKFCIFPVMLLIFSAPLLPAQTYTIPGVVHIGDAATIVIPLPGSAVEGEIILLPNSPEFPYHPDIDFRRIILERRKNGSRLYIEFAAFRTGRLEFPPVEIGTEIFTGIFVNIQSVIPAAGAELGAPASSLAIPGTGLMVYGTLAILVLTMLIILWAALIGKRHIGQWILKWKRRRLLSLIKASVKHMFKYLQQGGDARELLDILCGELRVFLSSFSGRNCRAMTAMEMDKLYLFPQYEAPDFTEIAGFPGGYFRKCDRLRFSGGAVARDEALSLLSECVSHIESLAKKEKNVWKAMRKNMAEGKNSHNEPESKGRSA